MLEGFIEDTGRTTLAKYHVPSTQEAIVCLLSLSLYGDYRLSFKSRVYNYHINDIVTPSSADALLQSIKDKYVKSHPLLAYEVFCKIREEHLSDIEGFIISLLYDSVNELKSPQHSSFLFDFMRRATHAGCEKIFATLLPNDDSWWMQSASNAHREIINSGVDVYPISQSFNRMTCHTRTVSYPEKQEVTIAPKKSEKIQYWESILLALAGSKHFSRYIANTLWAVKENNPQLKVWEKAIRAFSWNYRAFIWLQEIKYPLISLPLLDHSDVEPSYDNESVITTFNPLTFSWRHELTIHLFCALMAVESDSIEKLKKEIKEVSEISQGTIQLHLSGPHMLNLFDVIQDEIKATQKNKLTQYQQLEVVSDLLEQWHALLGNDYLITPEPENSKYYLSRIFKKSETKYLSWILDYCFTRKNELTFWLSKANTAKQVRAIIEHFDIHPLCALQYAKAENTKRLIMESLSE